MHIKTKITGLTIFFVLLFPVWEAFSFSFQENPLTKAIQLFDKQKFSEAETAFKKLIDERPDDFMINYFYGACRTENGHYSDEDLNYLIKASKEVYPLDIDYYFGVQYHAKNQWNKAIACYKTYKKVASPDELVRVNLDQKIEQCSNQINPFVQENTDNTIPDATVASETAGAAAAVAAEGILQSDGTITAVPATVVEANKQPVETEEKTETETTAIETDSATQITENTQTSDSLPVADPVVVLPVEQLLPNEEVINFNINEEINYLFASNFKTSEGGIYYKEGVLKQNELIKLTAETDLQRTKYANSKTRAEKDSIGQLIINLENQTYELKSVVTQLFSQSKSAENGYWQSVSPEEAEKFIAQTNAAIIEMNKKEEVNNVAIIPSADLILIPVATEDQDMETPKPAAKPSGVNYKIQLWAFSKGIPNNVKSLYSKISLIRKVENYIDEKGVVVYTTGNLTRYDDAVVMQNQVRQEGVKDALIAAYLNGKRITLEQATEIEKKK